MTWQFSHCFFTLVKIMNFYLCVKWNTISHRIKWILKWIQQRKLISLQCSRFSSSLVANWEHTYIELKDFSESLSTGISIHKMCHNKLSLKVRLQLNYIVLEKTEETFKRLMLRTKCYMLLVIHEYTWTFDERRCGKTFI